MSYITKVAYGGPAYSSAKDPLNGLPPVERFPTAKLEGMRPLELTMEKARSLHEANSIRRGIKTRGMAASNHARIVLEESRRSNEQLKRMVDELKNMTPLENPGIQEVPRLRVSPRGQARAAVSASGGGGAGAALLGAGVMGAAGLGAYGLYRLHKSRQQAREDGRRRR